MRRQDGWAGGTCVACATPPVAPPARMI